MNTFEQNVIQVKTYLSFDPAHFGYALRADDFMEWDVVRLFYKHDLYVSYYIAKPTAVTYSATFQEIFCSEQRKEEFRFQTKLAQSKLGKAFFRRILQEQLLKSIIQQIDISTQ